MSATPAATYDVRLVGYLVRQSDGTAIGEVEGVRPSGVRVHKIPGYPHHAGYVPAAAFAGVDHPTNTVILIPEITIRRIVDAPPPPDQAWRLAGAATTRRFHTSGHHAAAQLGAAEAGSRHYQTTLA